MREYLHTAVSKALQALEFRSDVPVVFEKPRQAGHGDLTTNVAMILAKQARRNPRERC